MGGHLRQVRIAADGDHECFQPCSHGLHALGALLVERFQVSEPFLRRGMLWRLGRRSGMWLWLDAVLLHDDDTAAVEEACEVHTVVFGRRYWGACKGELAHIVKERGGRAQNAR